MLIEMLFVLQMQLGDSWYRVTHIYTQPGACEQRVEEERAKYNNGRYRDWEMTVLECKKRSS